MIYIQFTISFVSHNGSTVSPNIFITFLCRLSPKIASDTIYGNISYLFIHAKAVDGTQCSAQPPVIYNILMLFFFYIF